MVTGAGVLLCCAVGLLSCRVCEIKIYLL